MQLNKTKSIKPLSLLSGYAKSVVTNIREKLISIGYYTKPNFIVAGAQKAGTTALFEILSMHPSLISSLIKEVHYFDNDSLYNAQNHFQYYKNFPLPFAASGKLVFEATPSYLYHPACARRIFEFDATMKIIIILREPSERALSAWRMYNRFPPKSAVHEPRSFEKVVAEEIENIESTNWYNNSKSIVKRGIYHFQIELYLNYFGRQNILILEDKTLKVHFNETIQELCDFLHIKKQALPYRESHVGKEVKMSEYANELELLRKFYRPHNEKLYKLINKSFAW